MRSAWMTLLTLVLSGCTAPPQHDITARSPTTRPPPDPRIPSTDDTRPRLDTPRIDIVVEDADLGDVLAAIAGLVDVEIRLDPVVQERLTTTLVDIDWLEAVHVIARMCGCRVKTDLDGRLVVSGCHRGVLVQDLALCTIRTVFQLLAAYEGLEVEFHPVVQGSFAPDYLPPDRGHPRDLLDQLTGDLGLSWAKVDDLLLVGPEEWVQAERRP